MKKISLKNLNLKEVEQMSREQLKNVLGGDIGLPTIGPTGITTEPPLNDCGPGLHLCECDSGSKYCVEASMDCRHVCP